MVHNPPGVVMYRGEAKQHSGAVMAKHRSQGKAKGKHVGKKTEILKQLFVTSS